MQFKGNVCDYFEVQTLKNIKIKIHGTERLCVVWCRCDSDTWFLTLRQENIWRVFENRVLRKTFGCERKEITRDWMKLHKDELYDVRFSPNIVRIIKSGRMRQVGHVGRHGERRGAYRVLVWKPIRKRQLGRPRRK